MKYFVLFLFIHIVTIAQSQVLQGDAEGKSSLLFSGKTLGIDLGKSTLSFAMNNFSNEKKSRESKHLLWGASVAASNKESVAKLFENSDYSTGFRVSGVIGFTKTVSRDPNTTQYDAELAELEEVAKSINSQLVSQTKIEVSNVISGMANSNGVKNDMEADAVEIVKKQNRDKFPEKFAALDEKYGTVDKLEAVGKKMEILAELLYQGWEAELDEYKATAHQKLVLESRGYWKTRHTFYFSPSLSYDEYSFYNVNTSLKFKDRFVDKDNLSKELLIGYNFEKGAKYKIGASGGIHFSDNNTELEKEEFRSEEIDTLNGVRTVRQIKKKEAYTGDFRKITFLPVNVDVLRFFNPEGDRSLVVGWHSYFRHRISTATKIIPSTTNIGTGIYLFKQGGVFAGGVYMEAPDLFNNIEESKIEPDIKPIYKRINVSIVAKFAFNSLLAY